MNILIVDDHPVVRRGLAAVLRQVTEVGDLLDASDGESALAAVAARPDIDVVILDVMLPGGGGMAVLEKLGAGRPDLPVIMLSSSENPADVRRALALGALGYVPKSAPPSTLLAALRLVMEGEIYVPPFMVVETADEEPSSASVARTLLTERQIEVLKCISLQKTNKQIAYELAVSEKTVKAHLTAIFRVLRVANRAEAVKTAHATALL